jgi:hypothetical protein
MKPPRILITVFTSVLLASFAAVNVRAAQLQIEFTGVDLEYFVYDDVGPVRGDIFDGTFAGNGFLGGDGDPAKADLLSSMDFFVDGASVGALTSDIYLDTFLQDVWNIPVGGGTVQSQGNTISGLGFDLLTQPGCASNCWGLGLEIDTVQVNYNGSQISFQASAAATGIYQQMLPFGLELDASKPITLNFTGTSIANRSDDGVYLTGFNQAGIGTITGTLVSAPVPLVSAPVPAAVWLFGSGLFGLFAAARRRKNT